LAAIQSENIQSQIKARDAEEFSRAEEETRLNTEREKSRRAMNEFIIAADLNDNEKQLYINYVNSGNADAGGLKELAPMINREEEIKVIGNAAKVKNRVTGEWEWDVPPEMDSQTGYIDTSPIQYNPASIARYNRKFADIRRRENDGTINQEEAWAEKANAANLLLARAESGYKYVEVPRQIGEETVITYQEIPANPKTIQDTRAELSAINERNRSLNDLSNNAIGKVGSIRSLVEGAVGETGIDTGSVWAAMFAYKPGTDEWTLRKDIDTLNADLGLTGLQEARMGSSSGASGFGQLTQTEMAILQERLAAISFGLSTEDFLENLAIIETYFKRAAQRSSTTLSYDQFIGIKDMPEVIEEVNR